jgi:8-oxo-dGTP pyrophosphatase MutT (NUDIX family)
MKSGKDSPKPRPRVKSCGVILFRCADGGDDGTGGARLPEFLLMKHPHRLDLPKGRMEPGETELECALREMEEETGIPRSAVRLDDSFRFEEVYHPRLKQFGGAKVEKTLVVFLGWLETDHPITVTEHHDHAWIPWNPPHDFQPQTINPLLAAVDEFFQRAATGNALRQD